MAPGRLPLCAASLRLLAVSLAILATCGAEQLTGPNATEEGDHNGGLVAVEVRVTGGTRRRLGEVGPVLIKGPRTKVANCVRCSVQRIPEMCGYQSGTEPAGAQWEDYQGEGEARWASALGAGQSADVGRDGGGAGVRAMPGFKWRERRRQQWISNGGGVTGGEKGMHQDRRRTTIDIGIKMRSRMNGKGSKLRVHGRGIVAPRGRPAETATGSSFMSSIIQKFEALEHGEAGRRRHLLGRIPPQRQFVPPSAETASKALNVLTTWKQNPQRCGMWTKTCVRRYLHDGETLGLVNAHSKDSEADPLRKLFHKKAFTADNASLPSLFPDLRSGDFGSCAIVAVGDNMLQQGRGREIDAHDTVFRYNAPMKSYRIDVGAKSDVVYWKVRTGETEYGREGQAASQFYVWKDQSKFWEFGKKPDWANNTFRGKPILWSTGASSQVWEAVYKSYRQERPVKRGGVQVATGGFRFALDVLSSGLCKRVDLYGFTAQGSGKYFSKRATMKPAHNAGLEHWVFREAQAMGLLCVYD